MYFNFIQRKNENYCTNPHKYEPNVEEKVEGRDENDSLGADKEISSSIDCINSKFQ